jgi:iron-sulfur cluster repair protein YtfE (RIC family)
MRIDPAVKVCDLYRLYPETHPVLAKYRIDLCCGGKHTLREVAQKHGVDLEQLLQELDPAPAVES